MVDALLAERGGVTDIVVVIGVAAVDDGVSGLEHLGQRCDRLVGDLPGRDHHPGRARLLEFGREVRQGVRAGGAIGFKALDRIRKHVIADTAVSVVYESPHEPGAHSAQADHSELHGSLGGHTQLLYGDLRN